METHEPVSADEASAALAAAKRTRARVAWRYPAWYWLGTGAGLGALSYALLLPTWWALVIPVAIWLAVVVVGRAASRARGVREGCHRAVMTGRNEVILFGPVALLMVAGAAASKFTAWPPLLTAVLIFIVFAGTGLTLSARAARP